MNEIQQQKNYRETKQLQKLLEKNLTNNYLHTFSDKSIEQIKDIYTVLNEYLLFYLSCCLYGTYLVIIDEQLLVCCCG
jgi:hypothetical protein